MSYQNVIVTGTNRGIGFELIQQFLSLKSPPKNLIATTRKSSVELDQLASKHSSLHVLIYDATNYELYPQFVAQVEQIVGEEGVDLLINNAGIYIEGNLDNVTPKDMLTNIEVNTVAPLALTKALLPALTQSAKNGRRTVVANISSNLGSISKTNHGGMYSYKASKAALNMISKSLAVDLKSQGITVMPLHPGWVQTDLGTVNADITTLTSVTGLLAVLEKAEIGKSGVFYDYAGQELPW